MDILDGGGFCSSCYSFLCLICFAFACYCVLFVLLIRQSLFSVERGNDWLERYC
jgi:hypothetical protein